MTKPWALKLLQLGHYRTEASIPFPSQTEIETYNTLINFLKFYSEIASLPKPLALIIRQVVQRRTDPISRYQWLAEYANIMYRRIVGECNIDYCNDCATSSMAALGSGEWMCVSPADAVQGEMECWDD